MKITITTAPDEYGGDIWIDTSVTTETSSHSMSFGGGEPEDMSLNRDLSDAYDISAALQAAYEAGKRGETLEVEEVVEEDE